MVQDPARLQRRSYLNWLVIVASVFAVVYFALLKQQDSSDVADAYGVVPADLSPLSFVTGSFVYPYRDADIFLLAVCMFYLWMAGSSIEKRVGHVFYLVLYFGGFACGTLGYIIENPDSNIPAIGAAGAIAAMLGAHVARLPEVRTSSKTRVPAGNSLWLVLVWALFQVLYAMDYQPPGVSGAALSTNLAGFAFGVLAAAIALRFPRARLPQTGEPAAPESRAVPTRQSRAVAPVSFVTTSGEGHEDSDLQAIFRRSLGPLDISEIGRTIAGMLKIPLADVTTRLHACSGFLADSLSAEQAEALTQKLGEMNILTFCVKQADLRQLPEAEMAQDAAVETEGLRVKTADRVETIPWSSILAANAGIMESWRSKEVPEDPEDEGRKRTALGFGPKRKRTKLVKEVQQRHVLDVLLREPWRRIRLQEDYTTFNLMADSRRPTAAENIAGVARELAGHSDDFLVGDGVTALAGNSSMGAFTYDNRRKYDLVNFWLLHRALYDVPSNEAPG